MRLNADLESRRSLVSHPRRKAGKGAVKLVHNEKRGAASLKPPPNAYRLAEARMKSVSDACFSLLFVGSMSPFRARPRASKVQGLPPRGRCLKEASSKRVSRWTKTEYKAQASDERATYREVHIHQRCEA